jgi:hypothetical protein
MLAGPGRELSLLYLLCPIYQLAQLINWPKFFRQFVNPDQLINWVPIDKWLLTYCPVLNIIKSSDSCHGVLGAESSNLASVSP